jgi:hypothetical protein
MKIRKLTGTNGRLQQVLASIVIGWACYTGVNNCSAQVPASGDSNSPPADAAQRLAYYQTQLGPYGKWVVISDNGSCWVPDEIASQQSWRPYVDHGQWSYTDAGWFWQSDYPWGDIVFHYGRWVGHPQYHWAWAPGYVWAPSWVKIDVNTNDQVMAVAPLPPDGAVVPPQQFMDQPPPPDGVVVPPPPNGPNVNVSVSLAPTAFAFISFNDFLNHNPQPLVVNQQQATIYYTRSVSYNSYQVVGGKVVMVGLDRDRFFTLTHHKVTMRNADRLRMSEEQSHVIQRHKDHPEIPIRPPPAPGAPRHERPVDQTQKPPPKKQSFLDNVFHPQVNQPPPAVAHPGQPPVEKKEPPKSNPKEKDNKDKNDNDQK